MAGVCRSWACRLALIGASLALPAPLAAHGGDSAIVRVAALDEQGAPWLLQLTHGLALRGEDGWHFVCPAAAEASMVLYTASADVDSAWVVTLRGVFRISRDGALEPAGSVCRQYPLKLVRHGDRVMMLARDSVRSEYAVCALEDDGAREIYASSALLADLASDGRQLWLARLAPEADGGNLELALLDENGAGLGPWQRYPQADSPRAARVRGAGGFLYATLLESGRYVLFRLREGRAEQLLESATAISGPVEAAGGVFAVADGNLFALESPTPVPLETPFVVALVDDSAGHGFAFAQSGLYELSGLGSEPMFTLDNLVPPAAFGSIECEEQWRSFELDLHAGDHQQVAPPPPSQVDMPAEARPQPTAAGRGCSVAQIGTSSSLLVLAFTCFCVVALSRRRFFTHT